MSKIIANRFELMDRIGQGGMGEVFRGRDIQSNEIVAVKQLRSDIMDSLPTLIERFEREGEALRQLNHPNIVAMLDAVEEDGAHYLVMEYVSGGSLEELLVREGRLPIRRVVEIGLDLADALTRAHRLKIIHRDIKPANVLLAEDGTPRLTDFGVAHLGQRTRMTESGAMIGTYAYLSPEACMAEDLDARADIWSFGVMLFQMLAGRVPFESDQAAATLLAIIQNPLPDLRDFRPNTPLALVNLISRMLEKDRDKRIKSVRQIGAELETIIQELDTPSSQTSDTVAPSRFNTPTPVSEIQIQFVTPTPARKRNQWVWIGAGLAALAMITLAVIFLLPNDDDNKKSPPKAQTVAPVNDDEYMILVAQLEPIGEVTERDVSRFIATDLTDNLENIPFSNLRVRYYPARVTSEEQALSIAATQEATVVIWGNYGADLIDIHIQIGSPSKFPLIQFDESLLRRTADLHVQMTNEQRETLAPYVLNVMNVLYAADGNPYGSAKMLAVLQSLEVTPGEIVGSGVSVDIHRALLIYMNDTDTFSADTDAAIQLDSGNPMLYMYQATGDFRAGDDVRALRNMQTAQRLGPENWVSPLYLFGMYYATRDIDRAIDYLDQIIRLRSNDWFANTYRGALYYQKGNYEQAKIDLNRATELQPDTNFPYMFSMMLALREGRLVDTQNLMNTILTDFPDVSMSARVTNAMFGDRSDQIYGHLFAAFGNMILGQYDAVITEADIVLAVDDQISDLYLVKGTAYCNLRDYAAAEAAYTQGIEIDPGFIALYALRAEARMKQENQAGLLEDMRVIEASNQWSIYQPLLQAGMSGAWSCETFWDYNYASVQ
jgi:serine/threonine protein kinase/tetratricopeptide (TPR) repeat protein